MDDYARLGVGKDATDKEIKKVYKDLAKKYHPDANVGKEDKAKEKFQEMQQSYNRIMNERKQNPIITPTQDITPENTSSYEQQNQEEQNNFKSQMDNQDINSFNFSEPKMNQDEYRYEIKTNLAKLIQIIEFYYHSRIDQIDNIFIQKRKRILNALTLLLIEIQTCFKNNEDEKIFILKLNEEDIEIIQNIAFVYFEYFLNSIKKYYKEYPNFQKSKLENQKQKLNDIKENVKDQINEYGNKYQEYLNGYDNFNKWFNGEIYSSAQKR